MLHGIASNPTIQGQGPGGGVAFTAQFILSPKVSKFNITILGMLKRIQLS